MVTLTTELPAIPTFDAGMPTIAFDIIFFAMIALGLLFGLRKGMKTVYFFTGTIVLTLVGLHFGKVAVSKFIDEQFTPTLIEMGLGDVTAITHLINVTTAVAITIASIIVINLFLWLIYLFVRKPLERGINKNFERHARRIFGGIMGAALGFFIALGFSTTLFTPILKNYNSRLDDSIFVSLTEDMTKNVFGVSRTISLESLDGLGTTINAIINNVDGKPSAQNISDFLTVIQKDPHLAGSLAEIATGFEKAGMLPDLTGVSTAGNKTTIHVINTVRAVLEGKTKEEIATTDGTGGLFDLKGDSTDAAAIAGIPTLPAGSQTTKEIETILCKLFKKESETPGSMPYCS